MNRIIVVAGSRDGTLGSVYTVSDPQIHLPYRTVIPVHPTSSSGLFGRVPPLVRHRSGIRVDCVGFSLSRVVEPNQGSGVRF